MAGCECCNRPGYQNFNRWALLVLTLLSWAFTITGVAHCSFWFIDVSGFSNEPGVGLFKFDNDGTCEKFPDTIDLTASHKVGQAFGVLATLTTGLALVGNVLVLFFLPKGNGAVIIWNVTRGLYIFGMLCVVATFAFIKDCIDVVNDYDDYSSNTFTCTLGAAGVIQALAFWVLLGVTITSFCTPVPDEPMIAACCGNDKYSNEKSTRHNQKEADVEQAADDDFTGTYEPGSSVQRTIEVTPEGRKITETVTKPDGSKVVTETLQSNM